MTFPIQNARLRNNRKKAMKRRSTIEQEAKREDGAEKLGENLREGQSEAVLEPYF